MIFKKEKDRSFLNEEIIRHSNLFYFFLGEMSYVSHYYYAAKSKLHLIGNTCF